MRSIGDAIHLVSGSAGAGQLKGAGARKVAHSDDKLTTGPCDVDPVRHAELRRAWDAEAAPHVEFRRPFDVENLRAALAGDAPILLWGTRAYSDLIWICSALDALERIGVERSRCCLARPHSDDPYVIVGMFAADETRGALAAATAITDEQWREGGALWNTYASSSPLAFDEARRRGSSAFPELTTSAELHGAWFPRIQDGRLRLSELDEVLLGSAGDSWRTPRKIVEALPEARLTQLVRMFDAYFHVERLRAWATRGVLERETLDDQNPFEQDRFHMTDRARALLNDGLERVGDAPPMYVGGCRANDPASPWVRIADDAGWRLALHSQD
ncbi:MAG TPA: hypothetical protein VH143_25610 [Kofleriaceae bacterium]|nr:hypothetical protein [Kofleriaceae bacterium]